MATRDDGTQPQREQGTPAGAELKASGGTEQAPRAGTFSFFAGLAPALTIIGTILYGVLAIAYARFYSPLSLDPDQVGFGYATTLTRSAGLVVVILGAVVLFLLLLFLGIVRGAVVRGGVVVSLGTVIPIGLVGLLVSLSRPFADLADTLRTRQPDAKITSRDIVDSLVSSTPLRFIDMRLATTVASILSAILTFILIILVAVPLFVVASLKAEQASKGHEVKPLSIAGFTILSVEATPAKITWTGDPKNEPSALTDRPVLYLGQANGLAAFRVSVPNQSTILAPTANLLIQLN